MLHAPLSFIFATERGRILSRFSRDLDALDSLLPAMLSQFLACLAALAAALLAILASSPLAAPVSGAQLILTRTRTRTLTSVSTARGRCNVLQDRRPLTSPSPHPSSPVVALAPPPYPSSRTLACPPPSLISHLPANR